MWGRFSSVASGVQNRVSKFTDEAFNQAADLLVGDRITKQERTSYSS